MNRKIILTIAFMVFGLKGIAQKSASISFYVMPQRTMFLNKDDLKYKGIVRNSPTYAYSYGVMFSQNFSARLGLEYGFCASRVEQEFKIYPYEGATEHGISNRKSILYVNIPLLLRAELISSPKNVVYVSAGPQPSLMVSEDGIIPIYYNANTIGIPLDTVRGFDISEASGAYKKFVLATAGSIGWNTKIYKNIFLQFLIRADYTLTDIENKSYDTLFEDDTYREVYLLFNKDRPATHIFTLGVGVGMSVKFR